MVDWEQDKGLLDDGKKEGFFSSLCSGMEAGSIQGSVFTLSAGIMGVGLLGFPYAMGACGLLTGIVLLAVCAISYYIYYAYIMIACEKFQKFTFVEVMEATYGSFGKRGTEISFIIFLFGVMASLEVIIGSFGLDVLKDIGLIADPFDLLTRVIFLVILNVFVFFPMTIQGEMSAMRYLSLVSVGCIFYVIMVVVIMSPWYAETYFDPDAINFVKWDYHAVDAAAIFFYGYDGATMIPIIYDELKPRSVSRGKNVLMRSFLLLGFLYLVLGILGYISFPNNIPELIVFRPPLYPGYYDYPMLVGRVLLLITLTVHFPLNLHPLRLAFQQFYGGSEVQEEKNMLYYCTTVAFLLIPMCVALVVPSIISYFRFLGGIFSVVTAVIFPAMLFFKCEERLLPRVLMTVWTTILSFLGFSCAFLMFYELLA